MMSPVDRIAHLNRWRHRSLTEKAVLALGMLSLAVSLPPYPVSMVVAAVMIAAALVGARVPVRIWLACAATPLGFLLTGALSLIVQVDAGGLSLAPGGFSVAVGLIVRSMAGLTCLLFLALTTPATDLVAGLRRLGVPAEITEMALLIYRFLFLLSDTAVAMNAAQASRLGHTGARRRLMSLGCLVANLLPRALDRARRLEVGLAARGWDGEMRVLRPQTAVSLPGLILVLAVEAGTGALGVWMSVG
jgi:cobalt/nickel transport system permease protein